jgi:hypothetical protein
MNQQKDQKNAVEYAMTVEEIGEELGLAKSAVDKILNRALAKLRKFPRRNFLEHETGNLSFHPTAQKRKLESIHFHSVDEYWPEFLLK